MLQASSASLLVFSTRPVVPRHRRPVVQMTKPLAQTRVYWLPAILIPTPLPVRTATRLPSCPIATQALLCGCVRRAPNRRNLALNPAPADLPARYSLAASTFVLPHPRPADRASLLPRAICALLARSDPQGLTAPHPARPFHASWPAPHPSAARSPWIKRAPAPRQVIPALAACRFIAARLILCRRASTAHALALPSSIHHRFIQRRPERE